MEIQYRLKESDFRRALITHRRARPVGRWFLPIGVISLLITALVIVTNSIGHKTDGTIPAILVAVYMVLCLWIAPYWTARSLFRKQPSARSIYTLVIDHSGIQSEWDGGSSNSLWKNYVRFLESEDAFLIYSAPILFRILPKRAFSTEQCEEFRSLAAQHIPPTK